MSEWTAALAEATGGYWPYLVVILFGFLPTEVWRVLGVLLGKGLDEQSEIFHWVRFVATGLVTAVVAKLLLMPQGALASVPIWGRLGAVALGVCAMLAWRRSILAGLLTGEIVLLTVGLAGR